MREKRRPAPGPRMPRVRANGTVPARVRAKRRKRAPDPPT
jgi:hypothetical protein